MQATYPTEKGKQFHIRPWGLVVALAIGLTTVDAAESCLDCHRDPDLTLERAGQTISLGVDPAIFTHTPHQDFTCADCHSALDPEQIPHGDPIIRVDCTGCHGDTADTHRFHRAFLQPLDPVNPTPATDCAACHGTHAISALPVTDLSFGAPNPAANCASCHAEVATEFGHSAHARALTASGGETGPTCLSCHQDPHVFLNGDPLKRKTGIVTLCSECHRDHPEVAGQTQFGTPFIVAYENSVHGLALLSGNPDAPSCTDCHGAHGVDRANAAASPISRARITQTCAQCHAEAATDLHGSAHGVALARGNRDAPTCTDCHGEHNILHHLDPRAPVSARNLAQQVCGDCHGSVRLAERYGISAQSYTTFSDSYHGLAGRSGSVEVVNCASCHGHHDVRPSSDPASLVHRDNLASTCGSCHPGANERFAVGKVHVALDRDSEEPILSWIATIYVWLIVAVIGFMVVHNTLDYVHKVRRKAKSHWDEDPPLPGQVPHRLHERMTLNERMQHGLLAVSFIVLVITGFMLRYPEAWWVEGLRRVSSHLFEWRSWVHRIAGVVMVVAGFWHFGYVCFTVRGRKLLADLWPRFQDARDLIGALRFNLGLSKTKPRFARFSYIEKAEYWAMMWGTFLMVVTGFLLWFDNFTMGTLTKLGFDIARAIHFYEAILATLAIIVWHFYFVIFNPDVYPMNLAWLTGKMSEEEMLHEHPKELERLLKEEAASRDEGAEEEGTGDEGTGDKGTGTGSDRQGPEGTSGKGPK